MDYVATFKTNAAKATDWLREQVSQTQQCRSCDYPVSFSESMCPQCGASEPARVPAAAVRALIGVAAAIVLFCVLVLIF